VAGLLDETSFHVSQIHINAGRRKHERGGSPPENVEAHLPRLFKARQNQAATRFWPTYPLASLREEGGEGAG